MLLLLHITLALAALGISTLALFSPSSRKLNLTYILTLLTLLSAGGLVVINHASIGRTCVTAFVYLAIVGVNAYFVKRKLAREETQE